MPYTVQFVGLAWFNQEAADTVRVLLPDGRKFGTIPPHEFSISVPPGSLVEQSPPSGWNGGIEEDQFHIEFWPPPSEIVFSGADTGGTLEASNLYPRLPQLRGAEPDVTVDPEKAKKVADLKFRQGTFEAFRFPGKPDELASIVSSVVIDHDEPITITLTSIADPLKPSANRGEVRTITLKAGTEIAMVNTSRKVSLLPGADKHDAIYSQLCNMPVTLMFAPTAMSDIPRLQSRHPFFTSPHATIAGPGCSSARL